MIFQPATGIDETTEAQVQTTLRVCILRAFVGRGLLKSFEAREILAQHIRFPVDAGVCIVAYDRATQGRLLRYCVRPLRWSALSKKVLPWCVAAPNRKGNQTVIGAVPRLTSCTSPRWSRSAALRRSCHRSERTGIAILECWH